MDSVNDNQVTIITAETGAGKSTQVPQFLAEDGYKVVVTQPRILAARSVSERISEEVVSAVGNNFDKFVGYRTAKERNDSPENQILFVTDGLEMVMRLDEGRKDDEKTVLVLDEVHEWNANMEVLIAWSKKKVSEDPNFKLVVMSATMGSDELADFFSNNNIKERAPVIEVPGRTYDVKKTEGDNLIDETKRLAAEGKNTLVFVPGKKEIEDICKALDGEDVVVLPLHGEMELSDQRKVFKTYDKPKVVVATNIAQTSVTINDIDAVVDSGLERQARSKHGIKGVYLNQISQADCLQRAGRAGRTKDGVYVLAPYRDIYYPEKFKSLYDRDEFPTPQISRESLDNIVLHVAKSGLDISQLNFFHQPNEEDIESSKDRLRDLGALDEDGKITKIGQDMERLSLDPNYARMMIEARKYDDNIRMKMATILAITSVEGICLHNLRDKNTGRPIKPLD